MLTVLSKVKVIDMRVFKLIIILFAFSSHSYAQECKSLLEIKTNKIDALIYINDRFIGKGNIKIDVTKELYRVHIRESLVKWNGYEVVDSINIKLCDIEYLVEYNLFDNIFVDSRPQGAAVSIFDNVFGYTPTYVKSESYDLIQIQKGESKKVMNSNDLLESNVVNLDFKPETKNGNFIDSDWFKILVGSAVVLGGTSAYFKIKADRKYDEYLRTQDKGVLDEVNRLDLYSGISFGLLQINFGYLIYKFLID